MRLHKIVICLEGWEDVASPGNHILFDTVRTPVAEFADGEAAERFRKHIIQMARSVTRDGEVDPSRSELEDAVAGEED